MKVIRPDGKQALSLEDAKALLETAQLAFEKTDTEYRAAGRDRTAALNRLNDAQKAFDAAVNDLRGFAPPDSDWMSRDYRDGVPA